jgi:fermentation-respiration switch protein FrsA (DUF1100 family)
MASDDSGNSCRVDRVSLHMDQVETPQWHKLSRPIWRLGRPVLIAYLLIVLAMMFLETGLVYPVPPVAAGNWSPAGFKHEDVWFQSADGTKLHGWFVPNPEAHRAILYCHGNGEDVSSHGELAAMLSESLQATVFIFDYRGYGHSEGRPTEAGCIADGTAAQNWLAHRIGVPSNDIVLMGRSLGSAVAVALAAENGARALVLENAFPTMSDVAALHYPWLPVRWIMANQYDSLSRIQRYPGPLLQCHCTRDELIPLSFARRLFDAAPNQSKRWMEFAGLKHNSLMPHRFYQDLAAFLATLPDGTHLSATP